MGDSKKKKKKHEYKSSTVGTGDRTDERSHKKMKFLFFDAYWFEMINRLLMCNGYELAAMDDEFKMTFEFLLFPV